MTENEVIQRVEDWLREQGWSVRVRRRGLDIEAEKNAERWFIEAKGDSGGDQGNQHTNFFGALGRIVGNRQDQHAKYSIALPDIPYYRRLWNMILATGRPVNSCLFVPPTGHPIECA